MRLPAKAALHDEIIRVSIQLGSELGEDGLTMRAIAARLGVSATALYQHFESKAAILREIRIHGLHVLQAAQRPSFEIEDPARCIGALCKSYIEFALGNPWLYRVLFCEEELDWTAISDEQRAGLLKPLGDASDVFARGVQSGQFRAGLDPESAVMRFWATAHGLASLMISGRISEAHPAFPLRDRESFVRTFIEGLVRSFAP